MACVRAKRNLVALEQFDFAVNRKHLLDEGAPEVQQRHCEWAFIFRSQRHSGSQQELAEIGIQLDCDARLATARSACFQQNAVYDFTRTTETLFVREAVVASESADGLAPRL